MPLVLNRVEGGGERLVDVTAEGALCPGPERAAMTPRQARSLLCGLPLTEVQIRQVRLPAGMSRRELRQAVATQTAFHFPATGRAWHVTPLVRAERNATMLLLAGVQPQEGFTPALVLPEPLALWGLAHRLALLKEGRSQLLVYRRGERFLAVLLAGLDVVYMRDIPKAMDLGTEIQLSLQATYLRPARGVVDVETIVWFGDAPPPDALPAELQGRVVVPDVAAAATGFAPGQEPADPLLVSGLAALVPLPAALAEWNLTWGRRDTGAVRRRAAVAVVVLLPFLLTAVYLVQLLFCSVRSARLEKEMQALAKDVRAATTYEEWLRRLDRLDPALRLGLRSPGVWRDVLDVLNQNRPDGVRIRKLAGAAGETVEAGGVAADHLQVNQYVANLEKSGYFDGGVRMVFSRAATAGGVEFQITCAFHRPATPKDAGPK